MRTGEPYEIKYRFKRAADGAYRWHLGQALPVLDDERQDPQVVRHLHRHHRTQAGRAAAGGTVCLHADHRRQRGHGRNDPEDPAGGVREPRLDARPNVADGPQGRVVALRRGLARAGCRRGRLCGPEQEDHLPPRCGAAGPRLGEPRPRLGERRGERTPTFPEPRRPAVVACTAPLPSRSFTGKRCSGSWNFSTRTSWNLTDRCSP